MSAQRLGVSLDDSGVSAAVRGPAVRFGHTFNLALWTHGLLAGSVRARCCSCKDTLARAFRDADHPEKLHVGIVQQNCVEKCMTGVRELFSPKPLASRSPVSSSAPACSWGFVFSRAMHRCRLAGSVLPGWLGEHSSDRSRVGTWRSGAWCWRAMLGAWF